MNFPEHPQQRWYDQDEILAKSVRLLSTFPVEIQRMIAGGIVELSNQECHAEDLMQDLRSLGAEKVLGIFKSKRKRRSYDMVQEVHQALNYMFILSEEDRMLIARQTIAMVTRIYDYLKLCREFEMAPQPEVVSALIRGFIDRGVGETDRLLNQLRENYVSGASLLPKSGEAVLLDETRLHVRNDKLQQDRSPGKRK